MHSSELHRAGTKSSFSLQLSKMWKKVAVIRSLLSTVIVLRISGHQAVPSCQGDEGRLGKKPLNGRWRWQSGIQFAKEKLGRWEAIKAVQRVWAWFSRISKTFYSHYNCWNTNIITGIFMQFSEFKVFWKMYFTLATIKILNTHAKVF